MQLTFLHTITWSSSQWSIQDVYFQHTALRHCVKTHWSPTCPHPWQLSKKLALQWQYKAAQTVMVEKVRNAGMRGWDHSIQHEHGSKWWFGYRAIAPTEINLKSFGGFFFIYLFLHYIESILLVKGFTMIKM